jgi:predicted secreted protein
LIDSLLLASPGAQPSYSLNPGLALLQYPLQEEKTWPSSDYRGGSVSATVYHKEVVAIESGQVNTMLGTYSPIFTGAWRIHYDLIGSGPRLFGGPTQFLWFAPGVGIVKHVLNSINFELAEFRLPDEVLALSETKTAGDVPAGGLVVVQLRGGNPDVAEGWGWRLAGGTGSVLDSIGHDFYPDAPRAVGQTGAGTYAYQFRAQDAGTATLTFEQVSLETGAVGDTLEITIHAR